MSERLAFERPCPPAVPIRGSDARFPARRIFCVGRNYAEHAAEMGEEVDREAPFYFTKSAHALCLSEQTIPFPPGTGNLHHEVELVAAIGESGHAVDAADAAGLVFGYACGIDLTRRDLQQQAKDRRRSWDLGKDFENAAVISRIAPAGEFGAPAGQRISLAVNGETTQDARLDQMVWSVPELISHLSRYYTLMPGDLIYTGTPAGVGPVVSGDRIEAEVEGLDPVRLAFA